MLKKIISCIISTMLMASISLATFATENTSVDFLNQHNITVSGENSLISSDEFQELLKCSPKASDIIGTKTAGGDMVTLTPEDVVILYVYNATSDHIIQSKLDELENTNISAQYKESGDYFLVTESKYAVMPSGGSDYIQRSKTSYAGNIQNKYGCKVVVDVTFRQVWQGGSSSYSEYISHTTTRLPASGYPNMATITRENTKNSWGLQPAGQAYLTYSFNTDKAGSGNQITIKG